MDYTVKNSRSKDLRESVGSYVLLMLQTWPAASMDKEAGYLESVIEVRHQIEACRWGRGDHEGYQVGIKRHDRCRGTSTVVLERHARRAQTCFPYGVRDGSTLGGSVRAKFLCVRRKLEGGLSVPTPERELREARRKDTHQGHSSRWGGGAPKRKKG